MELGDAVTLAGATILITVIVEAIKRALRWTPERTDQLAPITSIIIGAVVVVLLTAAQGSLPVDSPAQGIAAAIITGILAGAAASGLYDTARSVT